MHKWPNYVMPCPVLPLRPRAMAVHDICFLECVKSQTNALRSNLLVIKLQFRIGRINSQLAFPYLLLSKYVLRISRKVGRKQKKTMIYALSKRVVWDKTEFLLSRLLPVCTGSIIQKNHKRSYIITSQENGSESFTSPRYIKS